MKLFNVAPGSNAADSGGQGFPLFLSLSNGPFVYC